MAQEVRLQGRTYSDVPSILLPDSNNVFHPFTDVSDTTATAADVATGKYFYLADGTKTQGTSSGGGSSYTLLATKQFTASTTSTSQTELTTIEISDSGLDQKTMYFVRIYDDAGRRTNYFYGSNCIFQFTIWSTTSAVGTGIFARDSSGTMTLYSAGASQGYGVYCRYAERNGNTHKIVFTIYTRYSNTYSKTINGTYTAKVYALQWPDDAYPY